MPPNAPHGGASNLAKGIGAANTSTNLYRQLQSLFGIGGGSAYAGAGGAGGYTFGPGGEAIRGPAGSGFEEFGRQMDPNIAGAECGRQMAPGLSAGGGMLSEMGGMTEAGADVAAREAMKAGMGSGLAGTGLAEALPYAGAGLAALQGIPNIM